MNAMNELPAVSSPLALLLTRLPAYPGSVLFATGLNMSLLPLMPLDVLAMLEGRVLRIHSTDMGLAFDFECRQGRFHAVQPGRTIDLTIAAAARDFYLLARRQEDPDTLFFSRRLTMEGDTELGLIVKNTLDSLDLAELEPARVLRRSLPGSARGRPWLRRRTDRPLK